MSTTLLAGSWKWLHYVHADTVNILQLLSLKKSLAFANKFWKLMSPSFLNRDEKNLGAVNLLDEARDFETQTLQNIYDAGMNVLKVPQYEVWT